MTEWAEVRSGCVVVADAHRFWLHYPQFGASDPFSGEMSGHGSPESTRSLLDGSIAAARSDSKSSVERPPLTERRWAWRLLGYYQTTHATPPVMRRAAERFAAADKPSLAAYAQLKSEDEDGHDTLALQDLEALGYDSQSVVESLRHPTADALVAYFSSSVESGDPLGCVGYAYALERLAVAVERDYVNRVEALMPPGVRATRCLRVHSAFGSDAAHVNDAVTVVSGLSADERVRVASACYDTARIILEPPPSGHVSESELESLFSRFHKH